MRTILCAMAAVVAVPATAYAWDGPTLWYDPADGASPGGGGILGTGGAHDHGITCGDCHVDRPTEVFTVDFAYTPGMGSAGLDLVYAPGQRYRIDVRLTGAMLGVPCDRPDVNGFAATFETDAGAPAGILESDVGQSAANCPPTWTIPQDTGTTGVYGDCAAVFANRRDTTTWTFYWTAPAAGAVKLSFGGVDGDCSGMSMGDAVVAGSRVLRPPGAVAAAATPPLAPPEDPARWPVVIAALGLVGVVFRKR
jgi:hypothetical protein